MRKTKLGYLLIASICTISLTGCKSQQQLEDERWLQMYSILNDNNLSKDEKNSKLQEFYGVESGVTYTNGVMDYELKDNSNSLSNDDTIDSDAEEFFSILDCYLQKYNYTLFSKYTNSNSWYIEFTNHNMRINNVRLEKYIESGKERIYIYVNNFKKDDLFIYDDYPEIQEILDLFDIVIEDPIELNDFINVSMDGYIASRSGYKLNDNWELSFDKIATGFYRETQEQRKGYEDKLDDWYVILTFTK